MDSNALPIHSMHISTFGSKYVFGASPLKHSSNWKFLFSKSYQRPIISVCSKLYIFEIHSFSRGCSSRVEKIKINFYNNHLPIDEGRKIKSFSSNFSVCKLLSDPEKNGKEKPIKNPKQATKSG